MHPRDIRELGVALSFVPEDRLGMGLVGNMNISENMMLRTFGESHATNRERLPKTLLMFSKFQRPDSILP